MTADQSRVSISSATPILSGFGSHCLQIWSNHYACAVARAVVAQALPVGVNMAEVIVATGSPSSLGKDWSPM